jgi:hypothetical protein
VALVRYPNRPTKTLLWLMDITRVRGRSFLLPVLVEFLARRGRKRLLTSLWYDLCEVDRSEFTLGHKQDFLPMASEDGKPRHAAVAASSAVA